MGRCKYASERSVVVTHSPSLREARIDSKVSILNFETVRYWFRELRSITGPQSWFWNQEQLAVETESVFSVYFLYGIFGQEVNNRSQEGIVFVNIAVSADYGWVPGQILGGL